MNWKITGKYTVKFFIAWTVCIALASSLVTWKATRPQPQPIADDDKGKIIAPPLDTSSLYKMTISELQAELACYYAGYPHLDITRADADEYELTAALCARRWNRKVKIRSPDNFLFGGPALIINDKGFMAAAWFQYNRIIFNKLVLSAGATIGWPLLEFRAGAGWCW